MPSTFVIPVAEIRSVKPHPNADSLDIAQVLGWQGVVGRGQFKEGQRVVYFPADTKLDPEFSDSLGISQYLHKGRIKPTRLRGEPSFGLVVHCTNDDWQVVLYGEIVGSDVQSLDYGYKGHEGYYAFDLMIDGRYVDYWTFTTACWLYDVPRVPVLYDGPYDFDLVREFAKGETFLDAEHIREGVVVRSLIERHDPKVGRAIMKYVSDDYLLAKRSDFTEV